MSERKGRKRARFEVTGSLRVDARIPDWEREIVAAALEKLEARVDSLNEKEVRDGLA